jgi:hypothetical protein
MDSPLSGRGPRRQAVRSRGSSPGRRGRAHAYEERASANRIEIGATLTEASFDAVEDALNAQAVAHGLDQPVGLTLYVRLRQCASCGAPYLGEWTSRLCSMECCLNSLAETQSKQRAKRAQAQAEARAGRTCRHCGESMKAERSTLAFCSPACRQAAYRRRTV